MSSSSLPRARPPRRIFRTPRFLPRTSTRLPLLHVARRFASRRRRPRLRARLVASLPSRALLTLIPMLLTLGSREITSAVQYRLNMSLPARTPSEASRLARSHPAAGRVAGRQARAPLQHPHAIRLERSPRQASPSRRTSADQHPRGCRKALSSVLEGQSSLCAPRSQPGQPQSQPLHLHHCYRTCRTRRPTDRLLAALSAPTTQTKGLRTASLLLPSSTMPMSKGGSSNLRRRAIMASPAQHLTHSQIIPGPASAASRPSSFNFLGLIIAKERHLLLVASVRPKDPLKLRATRDPIR